MLGFSASSFNGATGFMTLPTEARHLPSSAIGEKISSYNMQPSRSIITGESSSTLLRSSADGDEDEIDELERIELTDDKIAEMIEVTFIKACFQLATGYVDVLKLFIASTTAAYERKIALPTLIKSVDDCPANTAGRDLSQQELEVRQMWIMVCYLTLNTIDRLEGKVDMEDLEVLDISEESRSQYGALVEAIVRKELESLGQQDEGASVEELSNEIVSNSGGDPSAAALLGYVVKVSTLTVSNIMEARLANEKLIDEDAVGPPRPNIPGAYK